MSLMGFQKKLDRGLGGWGELYPIFLGFLELFLTLQSPLLLAIVLLVKLLPHVINCLFEAHVVVEKVMFVVLG